MTGSLYPLTSAQALANLRLDLSDTDSTDYRWQDTDLNRAITKALEEYSRANPLVKALQFPAIAALGIYPLPADALYSIRCEYPIGLYPKHFIPILDRKSPQIPSPTSDESFLLSLGPGGALSAGVYSWAVSFTVPGGGETIPTPSTTSGVSVPASNGNQATIANLPLGPYGVSGRNLYRTTAGGSQLKLAQQIPDNTSATITDAAADTALGANAPTTNTTGGLDQIEFQLPPELLPPALIQIAAQRSIELTYAAVHQLDAAGTTIPESHWNVLLLGALAFAMWAYLPQVNDNFNYVDGHLRDRVDDTASTVAWSTQCTTAMNDFRAQLKPIADAANAQLAIARTLHWGDIPWRYERL